MYGAVECGGVGEGLMGEVMRLEVAPDHFDVIEFGGVFGQPLDCEPVRAGGQGRARDIAAVDGPLSSTSTTGLAGLPGIGP